MNQHRDWKNVYFLDDFSEKPCRCIGKFWGNVRAHRDILEIPCERGVQSTLGTPAHGISKMFLLTQSLPLSSWVLIELLYILKYPSIERGGSLVTYRVEASSDPEMLST